MAEAPNILAQGTIDQTDEVIYTVPGSTSAVVRIIGVNTDGSTTVTGLIFRANGAGASNIIAQILNLGPGEGYAIGPIALGAADTLRAESATGDDLVSYTVEGIEFS